MLLDSNIIIYAHKIEYQSVRDLIRKNESFVSTISYLETLGYQRISETEKSYLKRFFSIAKVLPISDEIIHRATDLRQIKKMSLGDAIIAATALTHNLTLVTRNSKDFIWIENLKILNPIDN